MRGMEPAPEWCAHPDHEEPPVTPMPANGYRVETFPSAHDVGVVLEMSIPMCDLHVSKELPRGIYQGTPRVVVTRATRGRRH
jgi:hypothetical protein